jgi:molybdopterin biosynthesis enzyme
MDFATSHPLLASGTRLGAAQIALAIAAGHSMPSTAACAGA